ncbi:hypothetical protein [Myxococcus sp. Y35]|uniref:hypothetical protein n=1 Tax=Pseudomyxococcus flavus TaxID=3115648 RepID=UPI003CF238F4
MAVSFSCCLPGTPLTPARRERDDTGRTELDAWAGVLTPDALAANAAVRREKMCRFMS